MVFAAECFHNAIHVLAQKNLPLTNKGESQTVWLQFCTGKNEVTQIPVRSAGKPDSADNAAP